MMCQARWRLGASLPGPPLPQAAKHDDLDSLFLATLENDIGKGV